MKEFISHIDYLIQKHDCVIIPDFGGFVLNHEGATFAPDGSILPPKVTVGFNPELKYNDGLLAESYMTVHSIAYEVACKRIEEAVKRLNTILGMNHPVQIGRLGKLALDKNNKLFFTPSENLSIFHPETFGLSTINIKRLADLEKDTAKAKRKSLYHRTLTGAAAAAAAVLVFFVASTPVTENINTQKSSFFTDWAYSAMSESNVASEQVSSTPVLADAGAEELGQSSVQEESQLSDAETNSSVEVKAEPSVPNVTGSALISKAGETLGDKSSDNYYVIIGGAKTNAEGQRLLNKFKSQGLNQVDIVASKDRIRIYVESFATRNEAETYLATFKRSNPQFSDAWVYSKN